MVQPPVVQQGLQQPQYGQVQPGFQPSPAVQPQAGVQQPVGPDPMTTTAPFQGDAGYAPGIQTQLPVAGQAGIPQGIPQTAAERPIQPQPIAGQQVAGTPSVGQLQVAPQSQQLVEQPAGLYPEQFADHLTEELRLCLDDCIDVSQVAAWAADRCLEEGPSQAECARLCGETAELGRVAAQFISRDAINTPAVVEAYLETAETALAELEQFDHAHTNEAAVVIGRSIDSSIDALDSY